MGIGKNKKLNKEIFNLLFGYAREFKFMFFIVILTTIIVDVCSKYSILYSSKVIDLISSGETKTEILNEAILLVIIFASFNLFNNLLHFINQYVLSIIIPKYLHKAREEFTERFHNKSQNFFTEKMTGEICSKINSMSFWVECILRPLINTITSSVVGLIITFIFIINISLKIAGITFILLAIYFTITSILGKKKTKYSKLFHESDSKLKGITNDSISNAITVKNHANMKYELECIGEINNEHRDRYIKHWIQNTKIMSSQDIGIYFLTISLWISTLYYWYLGEIKSVDFIFITGLIANTIGQTKHIVYSFTSFFNGWSNFEAGLEFLYSTEDLIDAKDATELKISNGGLELKDIDFKYKEKEANLFTNLSLFVGSKEKVGIVGRSGSGKSTLIKLILRYFDTDKGDILIDGQKIKDITQESLHKNIAIIPQEASLFNRSIMENIRYGKIDATDEEIYEAAKKAFAHEFIIETPNGYDSVVGEKGIKLSGGERQRIAIARAILKNSPILILDEATSALDSESEIFIQKSMNELMKDKTVIVIAHRLSTLKNMDRLVIMDKGEIIEVGSHNSLLRKKGIYHKLYSMQVDGFIGIEDGDIKKTG
jgi:ATP-binding cassette subfamily B protein